jgi:hypothetical protein
MTGGMSGNVGQIVMHGLVACEPVHTVCLPRISPAHSGMQPPVLNTGQCCSGRLFKQRISRLVFVFGPKQVNPLLHPAACKMTLSGC